MIILIWACAHGDWLENILKTRFTCFFIKISFDFIFLFEECFFVIAPKVAGYLFIMIFIMISRIAALTFKFT